MSEALRCRRCGDVIGVYEPLILLVDGAALETSRAAAREGPPLTVECYHRDCFGVRRDEDADLA